MDNTFEICTINNNQYVKIVFNNNFSNLEFENLFRIYRRKEILHAIKLAQNFLFLKPKRGLKIAYNETYESFFLRFFF